MTCTYDTSVCVACCHLAFSVEVSLTWCVLISRLFLSVVLCPSHLLNSFLSPGEQEICFHVILILIKVHIFSLSQSLIKWHLQQQVLGHGLSGSPEMCSCKQLFPWKECQVQHFRVLGKFSWSAWKKNDYLVSSWYHQAAFLFLSSWVPFPAYLDLPFAFLPPKFLTPSKSLVHLCNHCNLQPAYWPQEEQKQQIVLFYPAPKQ